jgi:hypothetical protein
MAEYSRLAQGKVTSTGGQTAVIIPFQAQYISIDNTTRITAGTGTTSASWHQDMGQGAAINTTSGTLGFITAAIGTGFKTFQAGMALQLGPTVILGASGGITQSATAPVVTTTTAHGLVVGDVVIFSNLYQTSTTGMQQMAGIPFQVVTVPSTTTFTINWNNNGSNYAAITAGGLNTLASYKQVLYPALYAPGVSIISAVSTASSGTMTSIQTTAPTNVQVGQEVGFHIPTVWGPTQLNELPDILIPGSPQYYYVVSVTDSTNFVINVPFATLTAYNSNQSFLSFPGLKFPQVAAVGDINSGGFPYTGNALYPSPLIFNGFQGSVANTSQVNTINGPAIQGAFINATFQGFIIGSAISGTLGDTIYWKAYMNDFNT